MCTGMGAGATPWCFAGSPSSGNSTRKGFGPMSEHQNTSGCRAGLFPTEKGENRPLRMSSFFGAFRYASERSVPMASDHCQSRFPEPFRAKKILSRHFLLK